MLSAIAPKMGVTIAYFGAGKWTLVSPRHLCRTLEYADHLLKCLECQCFRSNRMALSDNTQLFAEWINSCFKTYTYC